MAFELSKTIFRLLDALFFSLCTLGISVFFFPLQFRREVVHSLNDNVLVKIKQMGLSCYTMVRYMLMCSTAHTKLIFFAHLVDANLV